jgi:hypothetical protein
VKYIPIQIKNLPATLPVFALPTFASLPPPDLATSSLDFSCVSRDPPNNVLRANTLSFSAGVCFTSRRHSVVFSAGVFCTSRRHSVVFSAVFSILRRVASAAFRKWPFSEPAPGLVHFRRFTSAFTFFGFNRPSFGPVPLPPLDECPRSRGDRRSRSLAGELARRLPLLLLPYGPYRLCCGRSVPRG